MDVVFNRHAEFLCAHTVIRFSSTCNCIHSSCRWFSKTKRSLVLRFHVYIYRLCFTLTYSKFGDYAALFYPIELEIQNITYATTSIDRYITSVSQMCNYMFLLPSTIKSFPCSWLITGFSKWVPLVEQDLITLQQLLRSRVFFLIVLGLPSMLLFCVLFYGPLFILFLQAIYLFFLWSLINPDVCQGYFFNINKGCFTIKVALKIVLIGNKRWFLHCFISFEN